MSKTRPQLGRRVDQKQASGGRQSPDCDSIDRPTPETEPTAAASEIDDAAETPESETGPGRPHGSKNRDYMTGERNPGMCPKCKCTDSLKESTRTVPLPNDPDFRFVHLIKCMCKKCGQWRVDRQKCNPAE